MMRWGVIIYLIWLLACDNALRGDAEAEIEAIRMISRFGSQELAICKSMLPKEVRER